MMNFLLDSLLLPVPKNSKKQSCCNLCNYNISIARPCCNVNSYIGNFEKSLQDSQKNSHIPLQQGIWLLFFICLCYSCCSSEIHFCVSRIRSARVIFCISHSIAFCTCCNLSSRIRWMFLPTGHSGFGFSWK